MVSHWSLNYSKSPQVSRTFLGILAVLNYAIVWMFSTRPLISKFSSFCNNPLLTVPSAPVTNGITATFMFHNFFNSLARSNDFSLFSFSFSFILWSAGTPKPTIPLVIFVYFLVTITRYGCLAEIRRSVCISKS